MEEQINLGDRYHKKRKIHSATSSTGGDCTVNCHNSRKEVIGSRLEAGLCIQRLLTLWVRYSIRKP